MPLIGFVICVVLLVWRAISLRSWLLHPETTLQRTLRWWRVLHKIFFFVPLVVPYKYYERNPEYAIRSYRNADIIAIALLVVGCIAALFSAIAGT